jgi:hypothetical protein
MAVVVGVLGLPGKAFAQSDKWEVDVAPLYFWASELSGRVAVGETTVPLFLDFNDAADKLAGAFSLHGEARRNRWGMMADVNFLRLSTDADFVTPLLSRTVRGTAQIDMTVFEAGASYLVRPEKAFSVIGGVRTYTLSPNVELEGPVRDVTLVEASRTAVGVFGGATFRPKLSEKWGLLTRADIGGGSAFMWSATVGAEYRFKPWAGLMVGYHALGVDTGDATAASAATLPAGTAKSGNIKYDVTHYGPMFSLTFHWKQK